MSFEVVRPARGLVASSSASVLAGREFDSRSGLTKTAAVCGRAAGDKPRTQKETRNCSNSVVALQDHCSYKAPKTNHHVKKIRGCIVVILLKWQNLKKTRMPTQKC